ncbi:MAG: branched-chain amino acid ABC transporter permease [Spirochaetae bacterium HGW-Spirochaetae-3]|jgi:branched-chain amino acid transport system permease protein|nr:MAG: branched-chain amino acid ABC transporter permease [Spirochaetae bacterium HGW-Spirochaetae-3]
MKNSMRESLARLANHLNTGRNPYVVSISLLVVGTALVYLSPRSILAFLVFAGATAMIYFLRMNKTAKLALAVFVAVVLVPILGARNIFYLEVIFQIAVFAALSLGLNIVVGFSGILNLGYVAFYAAGAYLWGFFGSQQAFLLHEIPGTAPLDTPFLLAPEWFYVFVLLGIIVAAFVGLLLGLPVLRVRGDYLAIVTLGFGEVVRQLVNNLDKPLNLTNGPQGITPIQKPTLPQGVVDAFNAVVGPLVGNRVTPSQFYNIVFYFIALIVVLAAIVVTHRLDDSKIGRAWTAIREDELAATAMGIPANKLKLAAFAVGASFAGGMGVIFAASRTFVSPDSFNFMQSIGVLTMVILGGIGSIPGVIIGAAVVIILNLQVLQSFSLYLTQLRQSDAVIPILNFAWKDLSTQLDPAKYQRLLFGLILVLMMIYRPAGLIPASRRIRELKGTPDASVSDGETNGDANGDAPEEADDDR